MIDKNKMREEVITEVLNDAGPSMSKDTPQPQDIELDASTNASNPSNAAPSSREEELQQLHAIYSADMPNPDTGLFNVKTFFNNVLAWHTQQVEAAELSALDQVIELVKGLTPARSEDLDMSQWYGLVDAHHAALNVLEDERANLATKHQKENQ